VHVPVRNPLPPPPHGAPDTSALHLTHACSVRRLSGDVLEVLQAGQCFGEVSIINMCKMKQRGATDAEAGAKCTRSADIKATERSEMLELRFADAWPLIHKAPNLWCPRPPPNRPLLPYPSPYASPYRTPPHPPLQL